MSNTKHSNGLPREVRFMRKVMDSPIWAPVFALLLTTVLVGPYIAFTWHDRDVVKELSCHYQGITIDPKNEWGGYALRARCTDKKSAETKDVVLSDKKIDVRYHGFQHLGGKDDFELQVLRNGKMVSK